MNSYRHIFCTLFILLTTTLMLAQTLDYPIVEVNGQKVYRYPVKKSEGLWRISQTFGVSQDEIIKLNPQLTKTGLRFGETILIPVREEAAKAQTADTKTADTKAADTKAAGTQIKEQNDTIEHIIQRKETLYGISKLYGISINELIEANPEVSKKMHIGDRLLIVKPRAATQEPAAQEHAAQEHAAPVVVPVIKPEPAKEIVKQAEQTVKPLADQQAVPMKDSVAALPQSVAIVMNVDRQVPPADSIRPATFVPVIDSSMLQLPLRIAYLLPFCTDAVKREQSTDRFIEFYQGALLAIKEAQDKGQGFELFVYDTDKSEARLTQILQQPEMMNIDAIIGPAYSQQVSIASAFAFENHIPLFVPFTSKVSDATRNPYIFQFNPTDEQTRQALLQHIKDKRGQIECVFITTDQSNKNDAQQLNTLMKKNSFKCINLTAEQVLRDTLPTLIHKNRQQLIIFDTDKLSACQEVINKLSSLTDDYKLEVLGHYSWAGSNLPLPLIYTTIFHKPSTLDNIFYNHKFENYFKTKPDDETPRYDLLGYDLTRYMIEVLQQGTETPFSERAKRTKMMGLQNDIIPTQAGNNGGIINNGIEVKEKK